MAILFMDGFDHYDDQTEATRKDWAFVLGGQQVVSWASSGRYGGQYFRQYRSGGGASSDNTAYHNLPSSFTTGYFGVAVYPALGENIYVGLADSGTHQIGLRLTQAGALSLIRGGPTGTVIWTYGTTLAHNIGWYHLAAEVFIHDTTGTAKIWLNGTEIYNTGSLNTKNSANNTVDRVYLQISTVTANYGAYWDDLYVGDNSGSYNTTCPGDRRIITLNVNGDGANTGWTAAGQVSDYLCVDETLPNDDTDYVASSTLNQKETFAFADLPSTTSTVHAIQIVHYSRKDDAPTRALKTLIRSGGTDYEVGSSQTMGSSYAFFRVLSEENPNTTAQWTKSTVDAAEFGVVVNV